MNYKVMRNGQEFGPYTLADLQRYVASGNILVSDMVKSEGMDDWVPVSQVIGNIPVPAVPAVQSSYTAPALYPPPPGLHWGIALALEIVTCGLFGWAWAIVQAIWVRKVQPSSKGIYYVVVGVALFLVATTLNIGQGKSETPAGGLVNLVAFVFWLIGVFSMKSSIEDHFNSAEPIGLQLSGVMTFFFNIVYFQYHFTEIVRVKKSQPYSMSQSQA
jgi:hypothetical protein